MARLKKLWASILERTKGLTMPAVISSKEINSKELFPIDKAMDLANNVISKGGFALNIDGDYIANGGELPTQKLTAKNFDSYFEEAAILNKGDSITITKDYCLGYSNFINSSVQQFIQGYVNHVGVPLPGVNAVFIAGKYKSTWIGLHNDFCETFLFPIKGRKSMKMWHPTYFDRFADKFNAVLNGICMGHCDISEFEKDAIIYNVKKGEMLFIPPRWWHYNMLDSPESTLTISVGIFSNKSYAEFMKNELNGLLEQTDEFTQPVVFSPLPPGFIASLSEAKLPDLFEKAIKEFRERLVAKLIIPASTNGVVATIELEKKRIPRRGMIKIKFKNSAPFYFTKYHQKTVIFANGLMEIFPYSIVIITWLKKLTDSMECFYDIANLSDEQKSILEWMQNASILVIIKVKQIETIRR